MDKDDYNNEILRQLSDLKYYIPTTIVHFQRSIEDFTDKVKSFEKSLSANKKLSLLIPKNPKAAFYILPKIHKKYDSFPVGRPISSTISTYNKPISQVTDVFTANKFICTRLAAGYHSSFSTVK